MLPSILMLLAFVVFAVIIGAVFLVPLIAVAVNMVLLYFVFLKASADVTKRKRAKVYLVCTAVSAILIYIFGNFLPLWRVTTTVLLALVMTQFFIILVSDKNKA